MRGIRITMAAKLLSSFCIIFVTMVLVKGIISHKVSMTSRFTDETDTFEKFIDVKDISERNRVDKYDKDSPRNRRSPGLNLDRRVGGVSDIVEVEDPVISVGTFIATILKNDIKTPNPPRKKTVDIPVDNTISELTIKTTAASGTPVTELRKPDGKIVPPIPGLFGSVTLTNKGGGVQLIVIKNPKPGIYQLTKQVSPIPWNVEVTAKSTVEFTTKFEQTINGVTQEVTGRPTAGEKVAVIVTVSSIGKIGDVQLITLTDNTGAGLDMARLVPDSGDPSVFKGTVDFPKKAFQLTIVGSDTDGNRLQRLDTTKTIKPVAIKLTIGKLSDLFLDEDLTIPYTVENMGDKSTTITVGFKDDKGFAGPSPQKNYTLAAGRSATGSYSLHAGKTEGVITIVTLTAQAINVAGATPHHEIRKLTVKRHPDNTDPVCNVTSVSGSCSATQMDPCTCHKTTWSGTIQFGDEGYGLLHVSSTVGKSGSFTHDTFTSGDTIDKGLKKATIKSDCCSPQIFIDVTDMANNTGQCQFDLSHGLTVPLTPCTTTPTPSTTSAIITTPPTAAATVLTTARANPVASSITGSVLPVCNVTGIHGVCSKKQMEAEECNDHVWFGTVKFGEGTDLGNVETTLEDPTVLNVDKRTMSAKLVTTCCHALVYVIVGNTGQCELDARAPNIDLSPGAIAGITIGALAALVGTIVAAVLITKFGRCCSSSTPKTNTGRFRTTAWE